MTEAEQSVVADVAVPLPVRRPFSYVVPESLRETCRPGVRVLVPFGPRNVTGYVVGIRTAVDIEKLKSIARVLDRRPLLLPSLLRLAQDVADIWFCGIGEALSAFLPAGVKNDSKGRAVRLFKVDEAIARAAIERMGDAKGKAKQRAVLEFLCTRKEGATREEIKAATEGGDSPIETLTKAKLVTSVTHYGGDDVFAHLDVAPTVAPTLSAEQSAASRAIAAALERRTTSSFLLRGVTGSGKTEVYLDAIARTLGQGRSAIVLVPEISLTPQTVERFAARFGTVAVLHSHLTDSERARQWADLMEGKKRIAIGPRSAVFAPVKDLGLIVIDEEHESTFKQQNAPRYQTRDVARRRAEIEGAVLVLGSATPSLESHYAARTGALTQLDLTERIASRPMPPVTIVDMRQEKPIGPSGLFSPMLASFVHRAIDRGEQALLFLNRRGYNTSILCPSCGFVLECRQCAIPLVFYKQARKLICHYCNAEATPPNACPECRHLGIRFSGFGTETVEYAAKALFANARVARIDRESMRGRHSHEEVFSKVKKGEVDILVGTQMIAKGLDFPNITVIGVISAETTLLLPDFRAAERTFQLLTQVAGRSGRGAKGGRVFIQTFMPQHYSLLHASNHDFDGFAATELGYRKELSYPPFGALTRIVLQGEDEESVKEKSGAVAANLRPAASARDVTVLGPAPAPLSYIKGQYRYHIVLRGPRAAALREVIEASADGLRSSKAIQILVDVDPTSMM